MTSGRMTVLRVEAAVKNVALGDRTISSLETRYLPRSPSGSAGNETAARLVRHDNNRSERFLAGRRGKHYLCEFMRSGVTVDAR